MFCFLTQLGTFDQTDDAKREFTMSDWRILHDALTQENNPTASQQLVYDTEEAMFRRMQQLAGSTDANDEELRELKAAGTDLLAVKIHKLG